MKHMSQGSKKDLLVLQFATALLQVSKTDDVFNDDDLVKRVNNKDYHINKRIDRALQELHGELMATCNQVMANGGFELSIWLKKALDSKVTPTISSITAKTINLEMLALYVLFVNFCERDKTLIDDLKKYADSDRYFRIIDLMCGTEISRLEGVLFNEAYSVVAILKG